MFSCLTTVVIHAQKYSTPLVNIGDAAPALRTNAWIKGTAVNSFEKGKIYVIEFWATWCGPCKAEMPHLSNLSRKYKDSVSILGIDIFETKTTTLTKIKDFVDSMGQRMDYSVAVADSNMQNEWFNASGEIIMGIPRVFIVDRNSRLAWMGHPCDNFENVLSKIMNDTWDINKALAKRNLEFRLRNLEDSLNDELRFAPNGNFRKDSWKRDSALLLIDQMEKIEPLVKYTPIVAYQIFSILLKTNSKRAYEFGKQVIETTTYEKPAAFIIAGAIENLSTEIDLSTDIYQLGVDALQVELDDALSCYPEIRNIYKYYCRMADMYWRAKNKLKAVETMQKAIEVLKQKKNFSAIDLKKFETRLSQYKNM